MKKYSSWIKNNWLVVLITMAVAAAGYALFKTAKGLGDTGQRIAGAPAAAIDAGAAVVKDMWSPSKKPVEDFWTGKTWLKSMFGIPGAVFAAGDLLRASKAGGSKESHHPLPPAGRIMSDDAKKALAQPIPKPKAGVPLVKSTPAKNAAVSKGWYGTPVGGSVFGPKKF